MVNKLIFHEHKDSVFWKVLCWIDVNGVVCFLNLYDLGKLNA